MFSEFSYLKTCEESGWCTVVAGKVGRDLKTNISGFIYKIVSKVEIDFRELIRKK